MELYKALKTIIDLQGKDILVDSRLINILSDFNAYEDMQASKIVLKNMQNEGLIAKLIKEHDTSGNSDTLVKSYILLLSNNYGFQLPIAEYVLNSLAYAQGWIDDVPNIRSQSVEATSFEKTAQSRNEITDDGKHLLFKQFPITGDVNSFINLLVANGYSLAEPYNFTYNAASLIGSFAGNNDCHIAVVGSPKSHITSSVMVFFQQHQIWSSLKGQYEKIKSQLSNKYGTPKSYEFFSDPYYEGDGYELQALSCDHCTWMSVFETSKGNVTVSMSGESKVFIVYHDKINQELREKEQESIADDDL